jgi:DNA repair exonuclease SbcCD ATPase subunit
MEYDEYDAWDRHDTDAWPVTVDQFLERSQRQHNERLANELDRIDEQLEERDTIHTEIIDELEWKIERYTDRLEHLYNTGTGKQDGTRKRMKDRIISFQQQLREEHRDHWRDRQELERERRTILRELAELEESLSELLE